MADDDLTPTDDIDDPAHVSEALASDAEAVAESVDAHAEEDARRKEEAEARNQGDTLVYQTEKLLKEQGEKLSGDEKQKVEDALASLKTALAGDDVAAIKEATESLMTASQEFTQKLYESAAQSEGGAPGGDAGGTGATSADDDEVVDAEIVDE